jgi:hypothetical protein
MMYSDIEQLRNAIFDHIGERGYDTHAVAHVLLDLAANLAVASGITLSTLHEELSHSFKLYKDHLQ